MSTASGLSRRRRQHNIFFSVSTGATGRKSELVVVMRDDSWKELVENVAESLGIEIENISHLVLVSNHGEILSGEIISLPEFWEVLSHQYNEDSQFFVKLHDSGRAIKFEVIILLESSSIRASVDPYLNRTFELEYLCSLDEVRRRVLAVHQIPEDSITGFTILDRQKSTTTPILTTGEMFWKAAELMDRDAGDLIIARVTDDVLMAYFEQEKLRRHRLTCKKLIFILEFQLTISSEYYLPFDSDWEQMRRAVIEALTLDSDCSLHSMVFCDSSLSPISSRISSSDDFWDSLQSKSKDSESWCICRMIDPDAQILFFEYCAQGNDHVSLPKLLRRGIDINAMSMHTSRSLQISSSLKTGLHIACISNQVDVVPELCELGGLHINEADEFGMTALHFACISGNGKLISILLRYGANLARKSKSSRTPLHCLASCDSIITSKQEALVAIKLHSKIFDVNTIDDTLSMPIHYACARSDAELVELLISCGAVVNCRNESGSSPLTIACSQRNVDIARLLISEGANVDARDNNFDDSLTIATRLGDMQLMELLVQNNAKLDTRDKESNSLYQLSLNMGFEKQAKWLISRDIEFPILSQKLARLTFQYHVDNERRLRVAELDALDDYLGASMKTRLKPVVDALDSFAASILGPEDVSYTTESRSTAPVSLSLALRQDPQDPFIAPKMNLLKACAVGDISTVRDLWNSNQSVEPRSIRTSNGDTLLHVAAAIGCVELCEFLCLRGVGVNSCNDSNQTPLHVACCSGHVDIVKILIASGSLITSFDDKNCSPLHAACKNKRLEIILYFANLYTEPFNQRDIDGVLPLQYLISGSFDSPEAETLIMDVLVIKGDEEMLARNVPELLSDAITFGMTRLAKYFLKHDVEHINSHSEMDGLTPLHRAIKRGSIEYVKLLSRFGADFGVRSRGNRQTPLLMSAALKKFEIMKYIASILPDYVPIEDCDAKGDTCLHSSARVGDVDAFAWLLSRGSDLRRRNYSGETPVDVIDDSDDPNVRGKLWNIIHQFEQTRQIERPENISYNARSIYSACHGPYDAFLRLISACPLQYVVCDHSGLSPLHFACENNDFAAVNLLIDNGHPPNILSQRKDSPLYLAVLNENIGIIKSLLSAGAKWRDPIHDSSLLHVAVTNNSIDIVCLLLDYGFPVEATNASGTTALMDACQQGSLKICELLHEYGASLKCQLSGSPLHQACSMGNLEIVEWLLDNDIDPCTMYGGRSAFVDACSSGNTDLVALLYSRGFTDISVCSTDDGMNGLHWACRLGNKDLCRFLVDKNIDLDARNKAVESALSIALHACDDNIIHIIEEKTLLVYGENKKFTSDLINEFYRCLKANNFPVASYILRLFTKRIPLDTLFPGNLTLLHFAAAVGEEDTIQLLVSNNLNPGSCTNRGRAPLHYAASGGHLPAAKLLVSLGADPSIKDDLGRTCEDFARMRRDTEFVDWMASITTKSTFSSFFGNFACVADTASPEATKIGSDSQNDGVMLADSDEILYILWSEIEELDRAVQSTVHHS